MSVLARWLPDNPVLTKEMRVRMRGARAYWILLGYLGFLSVVLLFTYWNWEHDVLVSGSGGSEAAETGKNIFTTLLICQAFLVLFITPAITSGSITIEKEQQTLDMLTMTRLARGSMIAGKLLSAVSFTALLLVSSLPLVSICFMLGGVDPAMVFSTYLAMMMGSFLIGAIGLMWSSIAKTTTVSVLLTYLTMLVLAVFMFYVITIYEMEHVRAGGFGGSGVIYSLFESVAMTWCGAAFLGIKSVEFTGFAVLCLFCGLLMAAIATTRLETWPDRRAGLLRGLTTLLILLQTLAGTVWWLETLYSQQAIAIAKTPAVGALTLPLLLLMLIVPTFATGELFPFEARKFGKYLLWGWTPKGLSRGKLASGLPFLTLLTLLCIGTYMLTFVFFGKTGDIMHSAELPNSGPTAGPVAPPTVSPSGVYNGTVNINGNITVYRNGQPVLINGQPVTPASPPAPARVKPAQVSLWESTGDFPQAVLVLLTFVIGFALLCQFFSIAFRNRWIAWTLAYLTLFIILVLPGLSATMTYGSDPWLTVNLAYFNPFFAFVEMAETNKGWAAQHLLLGPVPLWLISSVLWTLVGSLSFLASLPFIAREARVSKAIPYEEMVMSA